MQSDTQENECPDTEESEFLLIESRISARIPIITLEDRETGLAVDICVNNPLAVRNSALLRAYSLCDVRVRELAYVVKHWTKRREMNNPSDGTLSSYGYVLMLVGFLQHVKILPSLQQLSPEWPRDEVGPPHRDDTPNEPPNEPPHDNPKTLILECTLTKA